MATFLDATLLGYFRPIATFLLVWVIAYGALNVVSPFGDETQGINALIAFVLAILTIITAPALAFLQYILPWMAVTAVGFFFLAFVFMAIGADMSWIEDTLLSGSMGWVIFISIIIALFGLGHALGNNGQDTTTAQAVQGLQDNLSDQPSQEQLQQQYEQRQGQPGQAQYEQRQGEPGRAPPRQGQSTAAELEDEGNSFGATLIYTFTHPKVLGLLFIMMLGALTIANLAGTP